jgi:hypothetical protein
MIQENDKVLVFTSFHDSADWGVVEHQDPLPVSF